MQNFGRIHLASVLGMSVFFTLTGCKVEIRVPSGGAVVSTDGAYRCEAGQTCMIDVVDLFFDQTFVAEPAHGYYFRNWRTKDGSLCGGEATPCRLSTAELEGHEALESILESDETFLLEPLFVYTVDCPPPPDPELVVSPAVGE